MMLLLLLAVFGLLAWTAILTSRGKANRRRRGFEVTDNKRTSADDSPNASPPPGR